MAQTNELAVAALLRDAESAHGAYERDALAGVYDQEWPAWYVRYLLAHGLADALPGAGMLPADRLAALLKEFADDYERERPATPWPDVYARRLVATLS